MPKFQGAKVGRKGFRPVKIRNLLKKSLLGNSRVQTIWTIETKPKRAISEAYCLNLVKTCFGIRGLHSGQNIKGTIKGYFLNAAFGAENAEK